MTLEKPCSAAAPRIQLHGSFAVMIEDQPVDFTITGRQGQQLTAILATYRGGVVARSALVAALWPDGRDPSRTAANLAALVSKTRRVLAPIQIVSSQGCIQLPLPPGTCVDSEVASTALHAAESAAGRSDWKTAWAQGLSALFVLERDFLPGFDGAWASRERAEAAEARLHALRCYARACLELGGAELASAERSARKLIEANPMADTGYCLLMEALDKQGDRAAALGVFERLRVTLRDELGVSPGPASTAMFRNMLA